jgi:hypothetical protein
MRGQIVAMLVNFIKPGSGKGVEDGFRTTYPLFGECI